MPLRRATLLLIGLLAGCAEKLPVRTLPTFASPDAWCAQLKGAACKGEWPDAKPGTAAPPKNVGIWAA